MEDDFKPVVQHQRMVNPKIPEVIKADFIKLLDAGLIYPISDSPWVSPVHVVPKKGGMTVVMVWKSVEYGVSKELDMAYWRFLRVGTTLDIFQNIILIPYLEYGVLSPLDTTY
ncbi:hypothetical protein Tco_0854139 [Tanacetum coccineum]